MKTIMRFLVVLLSVFLMITGFAFGQVPQLINYQGVLVDPTTGQPVPDDTYSITFSIYNVSSGGSAIWSENQNVQTKDGLYSVLLGSITPLTPTILSGTEKYLGIKVGDDPEMTPRKRIVSVAYSIVSEDAHKLEGKEASEFVQAGQANSISTAMLQNNAATAAKISPNIVSSLDGVSNDGGNIDLVEGSNITIVPDNAANRITISATGGGLTLPYSGTTGSSATAFSVTNTGTGRAGYFRINNSSNSNPVIYAETNGMGRVGHFRIVNATNDMEAVAASTQGTGPALSGYTIGSGSAVYGRTDGDGDAGYFEVTNSNSSSNALYGTTEGSGSGVYGYASNGRGVRGRSNVGTGVYGLSVSGYGVYGQSSGNDMAGVSGFSNATGGYGVRGYNLSGIAVYAQGDFECTGFKSAKVKLDNGTAVRLYAEESAENWFSDYGQGRLFNGKAHIELDPLFLQTVTIDASHPLKVFLQLEGDCNGVYVTNKTSTGFDVKELQGGGSNVPFSYRVVCKRKYYEDDRLATSEEGSQSTRRMMEVVWPEAIAEHESERAKPDPER